jgi:hypothetical protein
MSNNKKIVLALGAVLILVGLFKPNLGSLLPKPSPVSPTPSVEILEPNDPTLKEDALKVAEIISSGTDKKVDGVALSELYTDIALLISLDEDNTVVKTTSEIREVNSVAGSLMNLKLKGKYPGLTEAAETLVSNVLGKDISSLNQENRKKAVDAFNALAWGCYEGSK